jgi:ABC-type transport system substrate-binding protein
MGLNAIGRTLPSALAGDLQNRATFGTMAPTGGSGFEMAMDRFSSRRITSAETRWVGSNYGAWSNPEYDRLLGLYNNTLDLPAQIQLLAQLEKIQTEEVAQIAMYYTPIITPYPAGLVGPTLRVAGSADTLFKIWEWYWTA